MLFWEDVELLRQPRYVYVEQLAPAIAFHGLPTIIANLLNLLVDVMWHFGVPAALTFIAIRYLPRAYTWAHRWHVIYYYERLSIADEKRLTYENAKTKRIEREAELKEKQGTAAARIDDALTEEERWAKDLEPLLEEPSLESAMQHAIRAIYGTHGRYSGRSDLADPNTAYIPARELSLLDSWGLIAVENQLLHFSEKGKFFVKFLQEKNRNILTY